MPEYGRDKDVRHGLAESGLTFLAGRADDALTQRARAPIFDFARGFLR
jgi:hypothetical protein